MSLKNINKKNIMNMFFFILFIPILIPAYNLKAETEKKIQNIISDAGNTVEIKEIKKSTETGIEQKNEIDNLLPAKVKEFSMFNTILLDVTLPGGGHFYRSDYYKGFFFTALKLAGYYSIYYFARERETAGDDYESARNSGLDSGIVKNYERKYDRSAQYLLFAVFSNIIIYSVSVLINYNSVKKMNSVTYPAFEFSYSKRNGYKVENLFIFKYNYRI